MATEQRLRDELNRAAGAVSTDTSAALARVVSESRRRQRVRRVTLAVAAVAVVVVGAFGLAHAGLENLGKAPPPADNPSGLSDPSDLHAAARTELTGEWQSDSLPAATVLDAMRRSGATTAQAQRTLGDSRRWYVQMTFDQGEGVAGLVVRTSDPTRPGSSLRISDRFLYRLIPDQRLVVTPTHPGSRWVFSYRLEGSSSLRLRPLLAQSNGVDDRTAAQLVAWTYAPLTLVH